MMLKRVIGLMLFVFVILCCGHGYENTKGTCPVGTFRRQYDGQVTCPTCAVGRYNDVTGRDSCKYCPARQTTFTSGSASEDSCIDVCQSGEGYSVPSQKCENCPVGYYNGGQGANPNTCKLCPLGWTTQGPGSPACPIPTSREVPKDYIDITVSLLYQAEVTSCRIFEQSPTLLDDVTSSIRHMISEKSKVKLYNSYGICREPCENIDFVRVKQCEYERTQNSNSLYNVELVFLIRNVSNYVNDASENTFLKTEDVIGQFLTSSAGTYMPQAQYVRFIYYTGIFTGQPCIDSDCVNKKTARANVNLVPIIICSGAAVLGTGASLQMCIRYIYKRRKKATYLPTTEALTRNETGILLLTQASCESARSS